MLTRLEYKQVLDLIDFIYSPCIQRVELLHGVFERLQKLIGLNSAAYIPWSAKNQKFQFDGNVVFNASPKPLALYLESYTSLDPYIENGIYLASLNQAVKITDFVPVGLYAKTRYVREFAPLIPCFYEMNAMLSSQGDPIGGIAFHRKPGDRDFTERHRTITNYVIPHLANAIHRMDLLDTLSGASEGGMIVVDCKHEPVFMNHEARRALNGGSVSDIPDPGLSSTPVLFTTAAGVYRVRTVPTRSNNRWKLISLETQPSPHESKFAIYGLSKREREVALWVMRGLSNREIAVRLFICEQTVKDHLHDIFDKMKVRRRTELAAKFQGLANES